MSGLGYAVITTIPNSLVTKYHEQPGLYYGADAGKAGVGADIAILDSGYYLSQVLGGVAKNNRFTANVYTTLGEGGRASQQLKNRR